MKGYQCAQCLYFLFYHLGLLLIERHQRVHAVDPDAGLIHMMIKMADGNILQGFDAGYQRTAGRVVGGLQHPLISFIVALGCIFVALKHHLRVAQAQIERLQFTRTLRTIHILQLINQLEGGMHGVIVVAVSGQHDDEVGACMDILPEVLGRRILDRNDAAEVFDALIHLSHLEISHTTIAVGTYRREFSSLSQTISNSKEVFEIACKPGGHGYTVAMGTHLRTWNEALLTIILAITSREHSKGHNDYYTYYKYLFEMSHYSDFGYKDTHFSSNILLFAVIYSTISTRIFARVHSSVCQTAL